MPSVHMSVDNCYLYFIYKEILEEYRNTNLYYLVSFLFRSNLLITERRGGANAWYFFQSLSFFWDLIWMIFISERWEHGKKNWILSVWCKFWNSSTRFLFLFHVGIWPEQPHSQCLQTLCVPLQCLLPIRAHFVSCIPSASLKTESVLLLLLLTIAHVHSREEQLTNSWIVFVYMSELKANYLINVFCLEQSVSTWKCCRVANKVRFEKFHLICDM